MEMLPACGSLMPNQGLGPEGLETLGTCGAGPGCGDPSNPLIGQPMCPNWNGCQPPLVGYGAPPLPELPARPWGTELPLQQELALPQPELQLRPDQMPRVGYVPGAPPVEGALTVEYQAAYQEMYNGILAARLEAAAPDYYED